MKAKWTPFAQQKRKETARYLAAVFGRKAAMNFHQNIREWGGHITCYPGIGSYEPLLVERPEGFRSVVVHRNCKLVYYVDGDTLYIADLWDTRREPRAQAGDVK